MLINILTRTKPLFNNTLYILYHPPTVYTQRALFSLGFDSGPGNCLKWVLYGKNLCSTIYGALYKHIERSTRYVLVWVRLSLLSYMNSKMNVNWVHSKWLEISKQFIFCYFKERVLGSRVGAETTCKHKCQFINFFKKRMSMIWWCVLELHIRVYG